MPQRPEHWSVAKRFAYEFGSTARHLKKFSMQYGMAAVAFVLVVSCITWARTEASASDLPLVLLASVIHLLRGIAIVSLLFAWLGARFIQDWLYARTSNAWCNKEARRRPGVSFAVPYWRFYVPAAAVRFVLFAVWVSSMFFLLFVIPGRVSGLESLIPENFPF